MKPLGIYVHFPFCLRKCNYCNFYSVPYSEDNAERYVSELLREIEKPNSEGFEVKTLYFGGGTPSVIPSYLLEKVALSIYKNFHCSLEEFTVEVNPVAGGNIDDYSAFGVDRISVGVQSLDDKILRLLGRLHDSSQAIATLDRAAKRYNNVSGDLILGVMKNAETRGDINGIAPYLKHISTYMLKIENGTKFDAFVKNGTFSELSEDEMTEVYETACDCLEEKGFSRYEVSNFCLDGYTSRHNCGYWSMRDYVGFGPGAYSFCNGRRYHNTSSIESYLSGEHGGNGKMIYDETDEYTETVMLALRTKFGLNLCAFSEKFGIDFEKKYQDKLLMLKDFLSLENGILRIKPQKLLLENSIISELLY